MYSSITIDSFELENGVKIKDLRIGFHTYGKLNADKSNVVWVCHALTANSDVFDWWIGLFGEKDLFNPEEYFIVCANNLGSCYGSSGPTISEFPNITTRDMAHVHDSLRSFLGIETVNILIGASLGGQQALEWSILSPTSFKKLILIATNARHSAYGIAFNESQRLAIYSDPTYGNGTETDGRNGLIAARSVAMLSYRSYESYLKTQSEEQNSKIDDFKASSYQRYQGEKLAKRFNAYSYVALTKAMDSHNVGRARSSVKEALLGIRAKTLVIGITSDNLFPTSEQKFLAEIIPRADYFEIESEYGHDGFLIETDEISEIIKDFIENEYRKMRPTVFKSTVRKSELMNLVEHKINN